MKGDKALLIGTLHHNRERAHAEELLKELCALCHNLEIEPVCELICNMRQIDRAFYIGSGKLEEAKDIVEEKGLSLVIFDCEISPAQQRNLEKALGVAVIDRTEVILQVFNERAQTKEAHLQVKLASMRYELPRLKRKWTHLSRQAGGGKGYLKGMGEKQIEVDKRLIRDEISSLQKEITEVRKNRSSQRKRRERSAIPTFAIVGYTNAGKSTLLNALCGSEVLAEDKLFATLDTTTREFLLPNNQPVLLVDTVGFIRNIPHALVAAFKSTLEEALYTNVLIHVIDSSATDVLDKIKAVHTVLKDLGRKDQTMIYAFNKVDDPKSKKIVQGLRLQYAPNVLISAKEKEGFEDLFSLMQDSVKKLRERMQLKIPQSAYALVAELIDQGKLIDKKYEENDILLEVDVPIYLIGKCTPYLV